MRLARRSAAFGVLVALAVPFGIAVHLFAELVGLGDADGALVFSPRHGYLALLAVAALAVFPIATRCWAPAAERRRRAAMLLAALPTRGRGWRFFAAMFAAQIVFFYATQFGEGCPLCTGDFAIGIAGAFLGSLVCAAALALFRRPLVAFIATIIAASATARGAKRIACAICYAPRPRNLATGLAAPFPPNRPPPRILSIA